MLAQFARTVSVGARGGRKFVILALTMPEIDPDNESASVDRRCVVSG